MEEVQATKLQGNTPELALLKSALPPRVSLPAQRKDWGMPMSEFLQYAKDMAKDIKEEKVEILAVHKGTIWAAEETLHISKGMENNIEHKANPEKLEQAMKAGNVVKVRKALKVEKISKIAKGKHELAKEKRDEDSAKKRPEPVTKNVTPLSQLEYEHKAAAEREVRPASSRSTTRLSSSSAEQCQTTNAQETSSGSCGRF